MTHNKFTPHSDKQNQAIFSKKPVVVCGTGIQWGKTTVGAMMTLMAMHKYTDPTDNFLVLAPTYKIMQQSTLPEFLRRFKGCGKYHKVEAYFQMEGGGKCYMRTGTDPDSIVGTTNVRFIWGDEAGKFSLYFWENMQARAAFRESQICLTTSPYTLNWIYKELIRPKMKDINARPDVELIQATSKENPYFPESFYENKRRTMDPRRFQMMFGGEWNKFHGLVYDCFEEDVCVINGYQLPSGTKFYAGIDWGTTHPFAMHIRAITPDGKHIQVGEHYETGLTITDMVAIALQKKKIFNIETFYCDPSAPGYIMEFNRAGLSAVGAENDIKLGIDMHYDLIKSGRFKMFKGLCKYALDEYETYRYPDDDDTKGPNVDIKERTPVKQYDHAMDATRYVTISTYRHSALRPVIFNDNEDDTRIKKDRETVQEHVERLRQPKHDYWEDFS